MLRTFQESVLELIHTDAFFVHDVLGWSTGKQPGEFVVECDEVLRDTPALGLVGLQNGGMSDALHDQT